MKPSKSIISFLMIILLLSGCTTDSIIPQTEPSVLAPIATDPVVPETNPVPPTHPSVDTLICVREEIYEWADSAGNTNRVPLRIPSLNATGEDAAQLNQKISEYCNQIESEVSSAKNGEYSPFTSILDYEAYLNGNLLSLLLIHQSTFDYTEYTVYNFDIATSRILTVADMCRMYLDIDYAVFLKYTNDTILQEFRTTFSSFASADSEAFQAMEDMFSRNIISLYYRRLYVNEDGILMLVADKPSIAGAGLYSETEEMQLVPSALPDEAAAYTWLFDLYTDAEETYITEFNQILSIAQASNPDGFATALALCSDVEATAIRSALGNG